jgi:hypothetical protein
MSLSKYPQTIVVIRTLLVFVLLLFVPPFQPVMAQATDDRKPIDMMLVVDNSCSMFPVDRIVSGCEVWGNDPDFLRIDGVDLFVARLGFAEVNELEYQAGVISLGRTATLVAPLQPVSGARDAIARLVANPAPELGTNMVEAIKLAYQELRTSPARRAANLPAVVLMTDGRPYPEAGQSDTEIEELVSANPDIPFFIMLLQDPDDEDYEKYVRFWEQMQTRYDHIFTYRITDRNQIDSTYNRIIAQLQNTIPEESGTAVTPGVPYQFFVSKCVQEIVITVQHETSEDKGIITVQDPKLNIVELDTTPGVKRFRGTDNPVEVISIGAARLTDDLKGDMWTIESDKPVKVHLDRRGAYNIHFETPEVSWTDITNIYLATERQTPSREFSIRFTLSSDCYGSEPQPIWGDVITPDGLQASLRIPKDITPDSLGSYEIHFDFASAYPAIMETPGRFIFILNAGSALGDAADDTGEARIPIATTRLIVDVGRAPYIVGIAPSPLVCGGGASSEVTVNIGDDDLAVADTIQMRAFGGGQEVQLTATSPGVFSGDLSALCTALSTGVTCSTRTDTTLRLRLTAQLREGSMSPVERNIPVQVVASTCTPTPTATATPTPCPDRDGDGFNDCGQDRCPELPGGALLQGCPLWLYLVGGVVALGMLAFLVFWLIPWIKVHTCCPPPKAFVLVCRKNKPDSVKGTYGIGMAKRTDRITIGGDRKKAHIYVNGLKSVEFCITGKGKEVKILDAEKGTLKGTFRDIPNDVPTSNTDVKLRIGLDSNKLKC